MYAWLCFMLEKYKFCNYIFRQLYTRPQNHCSFSNFINTVYKRQKSINFCISLAWNPRFIFLPAEYSIQLYSPLAVHGSWRNFRIRETSRGFYFFSEIYRWQFFFWREVYCTHRSLLSLSHVTLENGSLKNQSFLDEKIVCISKCIKLYLNYK